MKGLLLLASLLLASSSAWAQNNCLDCHLELEDEVLTPAAVAWSDDVHAAAGLTCAACHGGDPAADVDDGDFTRAMDPEKGYIGVPERTNVPAICGRCHSDASYMHRFDPNIPVDQLAQYWTSVHGQRLQAGDEKVAECASCHGDHGIIPISDPRSPVYPTLIPETCGTCHASDEYMAEYDIPTTQLPEYRESVHGVALFVEGDISAPTCNSCHGNHGATPPGVESVSRVCGTCHAIQRDLFTASPHQEAFEAMELPQCETCHENHAVSPPTDEMIGTGEGAICLDCHSEGDDGFAVAASIRKDIEALKASSAAAHEVVARAGRAGMEVSEAEIALIEANQALVEARNLVHAFAMTPVAEKVEEGLKIAESAQEMGEAALVELDFRRQGLALSLLFILVLVIGLYLKIRQIEAKKEESRR